MKKHDFFRRLRHHFKRQKKEFKRRRNGRRYINPYNANERIASSYRRKRDNDLIKKNKNEIFEFLKKENFYSTPQHYIKIEKDFSIFINPEKTFNQLSVVSSSIFQSAGSFIHIDFSKCENTDLHTLFILRVIANEHRFNQATLQERIKTKSVITDIKVTHSKFPEVNKRLLAGEIVSGIKTEIEEMMPISKMGLHIGTRSQSHYAENKKGATATKIVKYITDNCLSKYQYHLTQKEKSNLVALISEVLNNAEDHSLQNKWYATASLFEDNRVINDPNKEVVGELSLTIMNFGQSFFEGLEETKLDNQETYKNINDLYEQVQVTEGGNKFSKDNYFTLYALQDGISRLKFDSESRGTGTMKFINSFMKISDYEDFNKKYHPYLAILTGYTLLKCDNRSKPYILDGDNYLSLNTENDLRKPPETDNLKSLGTKFPGTLLAIKIYLNKKHLSKIIYGN